MERDDAQKAMDRIFALRLGIGKAIAAPCACNWCVAAEMVKEQENLDGDRLTPIQRHQARAMMALEVWDV